MLPWFFVLWFAAPVMGTSLTTSARCEPIVGIGRLRCELTAASTARIAWADVVVKDAPAFVQVLRGRLAPADAAVKGDHLVRWEFGFAAKAAGVGDAHLVVRAVVCDERGCAPTSVDAAVALVAR